MTASDQVVIPKTLDFVLYREVTGKQPKRKVSVCSACNTEFRHGANWTSSRCPVCEARAMDKENATGFTVATQVLQLPSFQMFRKFERAAIYCTWKCSNCGHSAFSTLMDMRSMTKWKAACPVCERGARYEALHRMRHDNQCRAISQIAKLHQLEIVSIHSPEFPLSARFPRYGRHQSGVRPDSGITIRFRCGECGATSERTLFALKQGRTCSCRAMNISFGEAHISAYLKQRGISFEKECVLSGLGLEANLRFDFYIDHMQLAIEYDGQQHFDPLPYFGGDEGFSRRRANDDLKNKLAAAAGIRLIRIPFDCRDIKTTLDCLI